MCKTPIVGREMSFPDSVFKYGGWFGGRCTLRLSTIFNPVLMSVHLKSASSTFFSKIIYFALRETDLLGKMRSFIKHIAFEQL